MDCEKAAVRYHRACGVHKEARETIALADKKFNVKKEDYEFDAAWQEMLNRETMKVCFVLLSFIFFKLNYQKY